MSESPFSMPQMEEVDAGSPPIWVVAVGAIAFAVALATWMIWWLA